MTSVESHFLCLRISQFTSTRIGTIIDYTNATSVTKDSQVHLVLHYVFCSHAFSVFHSNTALGLFVLFSSCSACGQRLFLYIKLSQVYMIRVGSLQHEPSPMCIRLRPRPGFIRNERGNCSCQMAPSCHYNKNIIMKS